MEFRDLKRQYQALKSGIDAAILAAAGSGTYIMGSSVKELEVELAAYVGVRHCISCANGTDALTLALMAWGVGLGDAVFVPDFTFFATAEAAAFLRAEPVFVDADEATFNMKPEKLEECIKKVIAEGRLVPKTVIPADLFGLPADYVRIRHVADRYGLLVLEDGAQGFGGSIRGKKVCSFGDISTTSFFPAKPLGCFGDGGAVFTDSDEWAERLRSLRSHGQGGDKYDNVYIGMNSRLDTLQAAILLVKLEAFESELAAVNNAASAYTHRLSGLVTTPAIPPGYTSSWAQYTIITENEAQRDGLQRHLQQSGIPAMVYYPCPMHRQMAFANLRYRKCDCTVSQGLCSRVLSLPMHPYLTEKEIGQVCIAVTDYFDNCQL